MEDADLIKISDLIAARLEKTCVYCNLSEPARKGMIHFLGMVKDTGDGNYDKGVEIMRENNKLFLKFRTRADKVGMAVIICCTLAVGGGLWLVIKEGCKAIFKNSGG